MTYSRDITPCIICKKLLSFKSRLMVDNDVCAKCKPISILLDTSVSFWVDFWGWFYFNSENRLTLRDIEEKYQVKIPEVYLNNRGYRYASDNYEIAKKIRKVRRANGD